MRKSLIESGPKPESAPGGPAWKQLEVTARLTGERYGVRLEAAPAGSETEYVPERRAIRLDPERVEQHPDEVLWEVARESAHGLLSIPPERLLIDRKAFEERVSQLGYASLHCYAEDAAATTWVSERLPGVGEIGWRMHTERLSIEHEPVAGEEAAQTVERLGYVPRFVQFSQQLPRLAFRGEPAAGLDEEVQRSFDGLRSDAERVVHSVPPSGGLGSGVDRWRTWQAAEERQWRMDRYLWPAVERLAQIDLQDEALQQYLEELQDQSTEEEASEKSKNALQHLPEGIRQELEQHQRPDPDALPDESSERSDSSEQGPADSAEDSQPGEGESDQAEGAPESSAGESQPGAEGEPSAESGDAEPAPDGQSAQGSGSEGESDGESQSGEAGEGMAGEPADASSEASGSGAGESSETGAAGEVGSDDSDTEGSAGSAEAQTAEPSTGSEHSDPAEPVEQGDGAEADEQRLPEPADEGAREAADTAPPASPLDGLSDEAQEALAELYSDLPEERKEELERQALERLQQIEDAARAEATAELDPYNPETHQDRQRTGSRDAERFTPEATLSDELRERFLESLNPYERARVEVIGQTDNLYDRLSRLLRPDETGSGDYGYPTGQQLDMSRVMPAEHDFEQKRRLWIRDQAPARRDYRFMSVIDLSASMDGQKILETQKGFMVATEAIDRLADYNSSELTVAQGMVGFHFDVMPIMDLGERLDTSTKNAIGSLPNHTRIGTNTLAGTVYGLDALRENPGQTGNFHLTFSDGIPDHDIRRRLADLIKGSREEREATKTFMGLILLGDDVEEYAGTLAEEYGYDFVLCLPLITDARTDGRREPDFSERLADLLERLVEEELPY